MLIQMSEKQIQKLKTSKEKCIMKGDFDEAEKLQKQILELVNQNKQTNFQLFIDELDSYIEECDNFKNKQQEDIQTSYKQEELKIRNQISVKFHQIQVQHISLLVDLEKTYLLKHLQAKTKFNAIAQDKFKQAQFAAKNHNFERAVALKNEGEQLEAIEAEKRTAAVSEEFVLKRNYLFQKQRTEIKDLTRVLETELSAIEKRKDADLEKLQTVYSQKLFQAMNKVRKSIKKEVPTPNLQNECVVLCSQHFREITRLQISSSPLHSSRSTSNISKQSKQPPIESSVSDLPLNGE